MIYTEEKAKEIIEKYGLNPKTEKTWKSRGAIPDRYASESYQIKQPMSKADKVKLASISDILKSDMLNTRVICQVAGIDYLQFYDALRGKGQIDSRNIEKITFELKKLKTFIRNNIQDNVPDKLKKLAENSELKFYCINGKDSWRKSIYYAVHSEKLLSLNDYLRLKDNYTKLYITL